MGYDLSYFTKTYYNSSKANLNSQSIAVRYPFLCSRPALVKALSDSNIAANSRNVQGLNTYELADKLISLMDEFMYNHWSGNVYIPLGFQPSVNQGLRWDMEEFWQNGNTHVIWHNGDGADNRYYILDAVETVLLPTAYYENNTKEYKNKPFLGFDYQERKSHFGAELDMDGNNRVTGLTNALVEAGSFVTGVEYNIREVGDTDFTLIGAAQNTKDTIFTATGPGTGTGKARETAGILRNHESDPNDPPVLPTFMYIYNHQYYHEDLQPYGFRTTYWNGSTPTGWDQQETSTRYYDLAYAKFTGFVDADGKLSSLSGESRVDGDGGAVVGGWGYNSNHHLQTISWFYDYDGDGVATTLAEGYDGSRDVYVKAPRVLIDTTTDQPGYSGNKATVYISDFIDYFPGQGLPGDLVGYAFYGDNSPDAYDIGPDSIQAYDNPWDRAWPYYSIQPSSVRVVDERPAITATTRSLKTVTTATGAQRYSFEFEYPPMEYQDAKQFIVAFERAKGSSESVRIGIPTKVMKHIQGVFYDAPLYKAASSLKVTGGTTGATDIQVEHLEPNSRYIEEGTFFIAYTNNIQKIHQIVDATEADDWGRANLRVYPPLRGPLYNLNAKTNAGSHSGLWFLIEAFIVDDTFEYSVDAAGLYRISVKFREPL
jgi:hypothetical protein